MVGIDDFFIVRPMLMAMFVIMVMIMTSEKNIIHLS